MVKLDKCFTLHYGTEEIRQKVVMMWYDWYDWYIPINKIEIRENQYFVPLSAISTYRTSPPAVTQLQTETVTDVTHRGQLPERNSTDYNTISYANIVKRNIENKKQTNISNNYYSNINYRYNNISHEYNYRDNFAPHKYNPSRYSSHSLNGKGFNEHRYKYKYNRTYDYYPKTGRKYHNNNQRSIRREAGEEQRRSGEMNNNQRSIRREAGEE